MWRDGLEDGFRGPIFTLVSDANNFVPSFRAAGSHQSGKMNTSIFFGLCCTSSIDEAK